MIDERHVMVRTEGNGVESLFECSVEGCGRRLTFDHVDGRMTVLDRGYESALHQGSSGLASVSGAVRAGLRDTL